MSKFFDKHKKSNIHPLLPLPGPGAFTKETRELIKTENDNKGWTREGGYIIWLEHRLHFSSDRIDRQAAELALLKDEWTCEECEKTLKDKETGVTAFCISCWNAMITKLRKEIDNQALKG